MRDSQDHLWVVQHNKLLGHAAVTEEVLRLGAIERRLMGYLFATAGKTPQEIMMGKDWAPVVRISVAEYERTFGTTQGNGYAQLKEAVESLLRTVIKIETDRGKANESGIMFPLLVDGVYKHGEGWVEVELSKRLKPYLHDLSRDFTRYKLETLGRLSSGYAIRFYEWTKSHEAQKACRATVSEFRAIVGVDEKAYSELRDLQKRVLNPAIEQVNAETELTVKHHIDRAGRGGKIVGWTFGIETKKPASEKQIHQAEIIEHPWDVVPRTERIAWWDWVRSLEMGKNLPEDPDRSAWDAAGIKFSFSKSDQLAKNLAPNLYQEWLNATRRPTLFPVEPTAAEIKADKAAKKLGQKRKKEGPIISGIVDNLTTGFKLPRS